MSLPELDAFLFFLINIDLQNSFFDIVMPFITNHSWMVFLPLPLWCAVNDRKTALLAFVLGVGSLLLADWTGNILKDFFGRLRPCHVLEGVRLLSGCGNAFSMPSNHAVNAFAFITPFYVLLQRNPLRYGYLAVAVTVGFSRVYVGVHYPSDVVVGAVVGLTVSLLVMTSYRMASRRFQKKPVATVLTLFLVCLGLFRVYYILNGPLDLSPDEAHYWEWSRRLDLSYYSKGPMIAYLMYLSTGIFGNTVFGIRITAVILSTLSSVILYFFGKRFLDEKTGLLSAVMIQVIPLFAAYGIIFTIDSPLLFFWILSVFLFHESVRRTLTGHPKAMVTWIMVGLSVGFGLLSKYTMAFFYLCAFLFLVSSKETRRMLLTKEPYLSFAMSLLVFSPVIIWNATHNWVTLRHTAGQAHLAEGFHLAPLRFLEFIGSQFRVITPILLILMVISLVQLRRKRPGELLLWFSAPVIVFFLLKSMQGKVQANWAMPGYVTGVVAFSAYAVDNFLRGSRSKKVLTAAALLIAVTVTSLAHYPETLNLPVGLNPAARLTGWKDLGTEVAAFHDEMSRRHSVFIFSDRYEIASQLAFYVRGHPVTYCLSGNRRMNQYDLWPSFDTLIDSDAIFVRKGEVGIPDRVAAAFGRVEKKVFTTYTKRHAKIRDYSIFLCYGFRGLEQEKPGTY